MTTINDRANKEIIKARRALLNAFTLLCDEPAYNNENDIFHASAVKDATKIKTALETLHD